MTKRQLELKYGVHIEDDSYYNPLYGKFVKAYRMYTLDGCLWENGMHTIKDVEKQCKLYAPALLKIKNNYERMFCLGRQKL